MLNWNKRRACYLVAILMYLPALSARCATASNDMTSADNCIATASNDIASSEQDSTAASHFADTTSASVNVFFHQGWSRIDLKYRNNEQNLLDFIAAVDSLSADTTGVVKNVIHIRSAASPEGRYQQNLQLSQNRTKSTLNFIKSRSKTKNITYETESIGEDWEGLARLLDTATFEGAQKAAEIIRTTPYYVVKNGKVVTGRKKILMDMQGGRLWWKMNDLLFPELRSSSVSVWYTRIMNLPVLSDSLDMSLDTLSSYACAGDTLALAEDTLRVKFMNRKIKALKAIDAPVHVESALCRDMLARELTEPKSAAADTSATPAEYETPAASEPAEGNLALRTNLLFDAATLINCGVEVPIGRRWSVEADVYFPWWQIPSKDITVQLMGGTLEGKYWFGDRSAMPVMTGMFASLYAGAGYYDFQFGNGIQGELFIMGGLSVGYAHQLKDNLRLEYSLGLGYIQSDFREYVPAKDTKYGNIKVRPYPWEDKRFSGIMPTKASISLVWMLDTRKGGKR